MEKDFDLDDLPEIEEDSKIKKFIFLIIGLFLIILMFSYIIVSYPIYDILEGRFESNKIKDNRIELDEFTIFFENNTFEILENKYLQEQEVEFSACLLGKKDNDYYINYIYEPLIFEQTFNSVRFESCRNETLIVLHTHPYKSCIASQQDINSLNENKKYNEDVLMVVMCEPERFSVYN